METSWYSSVVRHCCCCSSCRCREAPAAQKHGHHHAEKQPVRSALLLVGMNLVQCTHTYRKHVQILPAFPLLPLVVLPLASFPSFPAGMRRKPNSASGSERENLKNRFCGAFCTVSTKRLSFSRPFDANMSTHGQEDGRFGSLPSLHYVRVSRTKARPSWSIACGVDTCVLLQKAGVGDARTFRWTCLSRNSRHRECATPSTETKCPYAAAGAGGRK